MDESGHKHKFNNEIDDENSYISSKRYKVSSTNENLDPSSSVDRSDQSSVHRSYNARSASKSSPFSSLLASEMGFDVLDSGDSNLSNTMASFAAPSSALSHMHNDSSENSNVDDSDLAEAFSESESNFEHSNQNTSDVHLSSNDANSLATHPDSESKNSTMLAEMKAQQFQMYHDVTPATLIPCSRTSFRGIMTTVGDQLSTSMAEFTNPPSEGAAGTGRAIRGNSMKNLAHPKETPEMGSPVRHKGRSPLASIGNATTPNAHTANTDIGITKKWNTNDNFFMYQKRDPRLYTGEDNFTRLSDEILLSIFKWLPKKTLNRCSLVNHRFHRVILDESLWTRLDLAGKTIQPFALGRILLRGTIILRLAQSEISEPIFDPTQIQKDFLARVQYLDLSMAVISTDSLMQLFSKCRQLRKLSLEHVHLNDAVCKALAQNRKLEVLNLAMCTGLTTYGVRKLLGSLKCLNTLNISWTSLEVDTLRELSNYVNENMMRLNIAGCRKTMSDDTLKKIVSRCPQLRELDLSDCTALTSQTIDIVASLKHLEYLSLSRCYNINVSAYLEINKLQSLAFLDIFGVLSDQALSILSSSFPDIGINKFKHSAVARPTVGSRRTSIWGLRTRD